MDVETEKERVTLTIPLLYHDKVSSQHLKYYVSELIRQLDCEVLLGSSLILIISQLLLKQIIKSKQRRKMKKKSEKKKHKKWPPFLHFHIGDLHTRRWTWTWLGGRRTWLGGRLEPLREFGILPFVLGGLAGIPCVVMWVHTSPPRLQLPAPCGGESVAHPGALVSVCGLPMSSGLEVSKHEKHAVNSMRCCPLLHGSAWRCGGRLPPSLACPLLSHRTPWRPPVGRRKERALKGKPVKEEPR